MYEGQEVNINDENGKKIGTWVFYAKDKNPQGGYPPEAVYEVGPYENGRKNGVWKRFYASGNLMSEITYKNGRPQGDFTTYHDKPGAVSESGSMNGRQMKGPHKRISEDGVVLFEGSYDDEGKMQGEIIYRHKNGQPEVVFTKENGKNVGTTTYYYPNGDVRKTISYNDDGSVAQTEEKERVNPKWEDPADKKPKKKAPKIPSGAHMQVDGKKVDPVKIPKYKVKIFLESGDILYDGFFENGEFKEGEFYVYDEDGLLHHIEVYKDFGYVGNGVVKNL